MEIKQENGRTICNYSIKEQEDVSTMVAITYMGDLQDFLKINYVADEVSFINHKLSKVRQAITELKPIVSFGDEPYYEEHMESMESEVIKTKEGIRNLYWWAVRYESFLNDRLQEINKPEQNEPAIIEEVKTQTKPIKPKKEFKDFFNPNVKIETIENIQKEFEEYDNKKMAYLIYLLHKEFYLINYSVNSRDMSRKHFVESLLNKEIVMQGINKCFQTNDVELCINGYRKDNDYISTEEKLSKTIV